MKCSHDYSQQTGIHYYRGSGSGGGINAIKHNTVNFARGDAPLSDAQLATMPGKLLQLPSYGALYKAGTAPSNRLSGADHGSASGRMRASGAPRPPTVALHSPCTGAAGPGENDP